MARQSWGVALETLLANPLRTLLSTLGVVIGVGSLVAILALGDGLEAFSRAEIEKTTDLQVVTVASQTTDRVDDVVVRRVDWTELTAQDADALAAHVQVPADIGLSTAYASFWNVPGDTSRQQLIVTAATPGYLDAVPAERVAGRTLEAADVASGARVALVSAGMARRIAGDEQQAPGRSIRIGDVDYTVVGVLSAPGASGEEKVGRAVIPFASGDALPGIMDVRAPVMTARARDVTTVPALRAEIETWLASRWPDWEERFAVSSNVQRVAQAQRAMAVFKLVMGAITGISLLVGGIGIMNVLLASISERTREIGIRRAAGARRSDIRQQFLAESVAISAIGSGLGLLLGLAGSGLVMGVVTRVSAAPVQAVFTWQSTLIAVSAAIIVGLTFGMYPAVRASRLSPIEALRHE